MSTVEEKYQFITIGDSITGTDWAAGSAKQMDSKEFIIKRQTVGRTHKYVGVYETVKYPPALWKIIDEPIVNALDHLIRCLGSSQPVTCIKVSIDKTGRIRIYNTGPGIEVVIHRTASEKLGKTTWVPTFIFGTPFQGSNRKQPDDSIIGGVNGLGAKLSNFFSIEFIVETVRDMMYFLQRWRDHKNIEEEPKIIDLSTKHSLPADRTIPHTTLSFVPDYAGLFGYEKFDDSLFSLLTDLIRTRVFFAAAYAQYTVSTSKTQQPFEIWFNDEKIDVKSIADVAAIFFPGKQIIKTIITPTIDPKAKSRIHFKYPWEVCAVVTNASQFDNSQLSNVNGVVVRDGKHYKHIMTALTEGVKEKISKMIQDKNLRFSQQIVSNNVFLFMNTKIPKPSWTGQRKDVLDLDIRKLAGYELDAKFIGPVAEQLRGQIVDSIFNNVPGATGKKKNKQTEYEKYKPARKAGSKRSLECGLIAVEGDSAMTQVCMGIAHNLGWDLFGAISLGGVIMNARKECTVVETPTGQYVKKTKKLTDNIFMNVLSEVTGLNTAYKYDPNSASYKKEMSELDYGYIAACVDQDLDGKGNILGLLLNTFELFWPSLLRAGYIKWFCTPIIRAYPKSKGTILEFYSIDEYKQWEKSSDSSKYDPKYYKGLGTHSRDETVHMFKKFREHLYTYYMDDRSHELFGIYFGNNPDLRKDELSKPTKMPNCDKTRAQELTKLISCSDHLEYETNLFQKDNLERKLVHVIDGQNQSGRKILDGLIKALKGGKELRVSQLGGYVSEHENYHHGEASLNDSITGKGFVATGGKQLPIIVPLSNFGSRLGGGNDAASARYIHAKLNKNIVNLIFPEIDYWILPFNFDEGKRSEPKYFVPIIPMAILESTELPAHGWKLKTWGRDVFKVIENVRRMIKLGDEVPLMRLPPTVYRGAPYEWTGEIKTIRGEPYSFGRYSLDQTKNILTITELPLRVWNNPYINMLRKKMNRPDEKIIAGINDLSDDLKVNIEIKLKPGAISLLDAGGDMVWADGVEEYFQLRDRMDSHINLMGVNSEVIMFSSYESVMHHWFPVRKEYYGKRIMRHRKLLVLTVRMLENVIRYIEESTRLNLSKRKKAEMERVLTEENFDKLHVGKLNNPKFTPIEQIEEVVLRDTKANYDYLLGLSDLKKSEESLAEFRQKLSNVKAEILDLDEVSNRGRFPGSVVWESELDALEIQIREGQKTFWKYGDVSKYKFE